MLLTPFRPFPTLTTNRMVLRQLRKTDLPEIYFLRSDPRVLKYLDREPNTEEQAAKWLDMVIDLDEKGDGINWAMTMKGHDRLIGNICFWNFRKEHDRVETGYVIHPDFGGKGLMDEAMKAILAFGFEKMKIHSVEANINPANDASRRLLERNGFIREAYFRENIFHNGRYLDTAIYSLIKPQS